MKSVLAKVEDNRAHLEIEVPPEEVEKALDRAYRRLARNILIPGFRKGKAPRPLVERRIGKAALYDEALEDLLLVAYLRAVDETGIEPIDRPEISDIDLQDGQPLVFKAVVLVKPEVQLGDYNSIRVEKDVPEVTDEDVENVVQGLLEENAQLVSVDDEAKAEKGLFASIDFHGTIDGEPFEGGSAENYLVEIGASRLLEQFEEQLIGMAVDEQRQITVNYPEDFPDEQLAGKTAVFDVRLKGLKRKELPELNDDFAKTVGEFSTLEELRQDIRNTLSQRAETAAQQRLEQDVIQTLVDGSEVEIPDVLVERRIDQLIDDFRRQLETQNLKLEDALQQEGKSMEEFRGQFRETAERDVKTELVLDAVARKENIEVTEDDLAAEAVRLAEAYGQDVAAMRRLLQQPELKSDVESSILMRKTVDFLVQKATAQEA